MANRLFDQFTKEMREKGVDPGKNDDSSGETELLRALKEHVGKERGSQTHHDHGSFTRHSSSAALEDEKDQDQEQSQDTTVNLPAA